MSKRDDTCTYVIRTYVVPHGSYLAAHPAGVIAAGRPIGAAPICGFPSAPGEYCELSVGHAGACGRGSRVPA